MKIYVLVLVLISICFYYSPILGSGEQHDNFEHPLPAEYDTPDGPENGPLQVDRKNELKSLLPQVGEVDGWRPEGETEIAEGEDLFLLIDGGAEIYHEYGFKEVAFQTYVNEDGKSINLEIYIMNDQEAAYGIYTFKTGKDGLPIEIGHEGWIESYYLNFWKGNTLVTVIGLDTDNTIIDGIKKIAEVVDSKLVFRSKKPHITSFLPKENLQVNGITYLKGNLALFNQYRFDTQDIFGVKEGVVGEYKNYSIFIFQYGNQEDSGRWYEYAKNQLKHSQRFDNFEDRTTHFEISDFQNNRLSIKHDHNRILIVLGKNHVNTSRILNSLDVPEN